MLLTSDCSESYFWIYSCLQTIQVNSFFSYNLIRSDHPSDSKRGGVRIYYKEHIPHVKRVEICTSDNCLVTKIRSQSEKCFLTCIYRSPSQNNKEFENLLRKFWFTS